MASRLLIFVSVSDLSFFALLDTVSFLFLPVGCVLIVVREKELLANMYACKPSKCHRASRSAHRFTGKPELISELPAVAVSMKILSGNKLLGTAIYSALTSSLLYIALEEWKWMAKNNKEALLNRVSLLMRRFACIHISQKFRFSYYY